MATLTVDIHPHIVADDEKKYPRVPLFGAQSDWSRTRPVAIERLVKSMDERGVDKATIVQAPTCYGVRQFLRRGFDKAVSGPLRRRHRHSRGPSA